MPPRTAWLMIVALFSAAARADAAAAAPPPVHGEAGSFWREVAQTWEHGSLELYVPLKTYHMPYAYSSALRRSYNDFPAGGGLGMGHYGARGDWVGLFALEFSDSHRKPQYNGGLAWVPTWHPFSDSLRVGAGLAGLVIARSDIRHYTPFPGVLPLGSIGVWDLDLQATFIPGGKGDGNVVFSWVKLAFN